MSLKKPKRLKPPLFSIIISTYNRHDLLSKCLDSLVVQSLESKYFEVIVVDNNSTDQTPAVVKSFQEEHPAIRLIYKFESEPGISPARNSGANQVKGEYLAFIDDDAQADKDWLLHAQELTEKSEANIFGGPIYPEFESKPPAWFKPDYEIRSFGKLRRELRKHEFLSGSNIFIRKQIFESLGGFATDLGMMPEQRRFGEETQLQRRYRQNFDKSIIYDPKIRVNHLVPDYKTKLRYIFQTHFQQGRSHRSGSSRFKLVLKTGLSIIQALCSGSIGVLLRDRRAFPAWQNYYWEVVSPSVFWLGSWKGER